jgi:hypothetical protein
MIDLFNPGRVSHNPEIPVIKVKLLTQVLGITLGPCIIEKTSVQV